MENNGDETKQKKNDQPVMFGHVAVCHRSLSLSFFFYTTD